MVTIYDIAKACGVSGATVSKALNNHRDISEERKKMIYEKAEELGYMPNSHARSLITKRSYNIGILFMDESQNGLTHQLFSSILESIRSTLEEKGYDISFLSKRIKGEKGGYLEHCKYRGVDGVIIACINFDSEDVRKLIDSDVPTVLIDKEIPGKTCILSSNYEGTQKAVEYLIHMGHKKIGFIHGQPTSTLVTQKRISAFYDTMEKFKLSLNKEWICEGGYYEWEKTYSAVIKILSEKDRPTALLLPDDYSALAVYKAVSDLNLRIPNDISIIGNDGISITDIMTPRLTTILQNSTEIGRSAAEQIIRLVENHRSKPKIIRVDTRLKEGATVANLQKGFYNL